MERRRLCVALIASGLLSLFAAEPIFAQPPQGGGGGGQRRFFNRGYRGGPMGERWRQMSPEDRQRFRMNAERWLQMSPEERRILRERETMRRMRLQREAETALQQSGLQLEAEKRDAYERRYMQERRRIERNIRLEMEERRKRELGPVQEQLKKEFAPGQGNATPNAATSVAPTPNK